MSASLHNLDSQVKTCIPSDLQNNLQKISKEESLSQTNISFDATMGTLWADQGKTLVAKESCNT